MKRTAPVFLFAVLVAAFGFQVRPAEAFQGFDDGGGAGVSDCASCHPDLANFGPDHGAHAALSNDDCNSCHGGGGRDNPPLANCVRCHGRDADAGGDNISAGLGRGLRQHHVTVGAAACGNCHSDTVNATTGSAPENVLPSFYPQALGGAGLDPCDGSEEQFPSRSVSLDNDGDGDTDLLDSDCQAATAPQIGVAPSPNDYGDVTVGDSLSQEFTISNTGTAALDVSGMTLGDTTNYSLNVNGGGTPCGSATPTIAAGGGSCTVAVTFSPLSAGAHDSNLSIASNDTTNSPLNVPLTGNGVVPPTPTPDIAVTDSVAPGNDLDVPFGSVTVGTSADQTVTVTNAGTDNLLIGTVASADPLPAPFSILNDTCSSQTLAPSASCTITVRFAPNATSSLSDTFDIPSNDPDEDPVTVSVSGTGTGAPVPNISVPASVDLGEVVENDTSAPSEVIISNTGSLDLTVSSIAIDAGTDFTLDLGGGSNPCTTANPIIPAGDNCSVVVVFAPKSVGAISDNLAITSDDPDQPNVNVLLSGTGLDNVTPAVTAATGTGTITLDTSGNPGTSVSGIQALLDTDPGLNQTGKPSGVTFPHGLVSFTVNNVAPGGTITVDITFPAAIPAGSKYYKVNAGGFFEFAGAEISGSTVTLTLTDGGSGDLDAIPGTITDPGGLAVPVPQSSSSSSSGCSVIGSGGNEGGGAVLFLTLLAILVTLRRQGAKARR
jgi:hypothetical protein